MRYNKISYLKKVQQKYFDDILQQYSLRLISYQDTARIFAYAPAEQWRKLTILARKLIQSEMRAAFYEEDIIS